MHEIFINLKRFDVPKKMGGLCLTDDAQAWIEDIIEQTVKLGLGKLDDVNVAYTIPDALVLPAIKKLNSFPKEERFNLSVGNQSVFRQDIAPGGNFGAFTSNTPAAAAANMGCTWSIIGHSEERKDKFEMLCRFEPAAATDSAQMAKANKAVSEMLNEQALCAFKQGINALFCIGETAEERGEGDFEEQKPRIEAVLKAQLEVGLKGLAEFLPERKVVIGYEPRWAIGPGKTPPGAEYIGYVAEFTKKTVKELYGFDIPVVYGGGLKEENAKMIGGIESIDGGLVALTKFTDPIAFQPEDLKIIIETYLSA
ncbi:MAG: triose-phosphate isomerase [Pontiella sp.]|nr:triose-phosphate isomerase [Pontiella sp.]MBT8046085.1 triose-phosphate isomerase [Pontiella sp.]NNJ70957.1 triosephosphate isomerase [Kiritimatiellales bacterium]